MALGNKEIMAKNISKYMEKAGIDRNKLSTDLGISYTTITDWIKGKTYPRIDKIELLANYFGISKSDLVEDSVSDITTIYNQLTEKRQAKVYNFADRQLREQKYGVADAGKIIPLPKQQKQTVDIYGRLSAGGGAYNDKTVVETVEVNSAPSKYDMAFVVTGDSMFPTFEDGEVVFVNETQDVFNGQIAAIEINDEAFIKKVYIEGKRMRMVSLNVDVDQNGNRLYPDFYADECDNLFVIGRVIM